jgi:hypothetical protein
VKDGTVKKRWGEMENERDLMLAEMELITVRSSSPAQNSTRRVGLVRGQRWNKLAARRKK